MHFLLISLVILGLRIQFEDTQTANYSISFNRQDVVALASDRTSPSSAAVDSYPLCFGGRGVPNAFFWVILAWPNILY